MTLIAKNEVRVSRTETSEENKQKRLHDLCGFRKGTKSQKLAMALQEIMARCQQAQADVSEAGVPVVRSGGRNAVLVCIVAGAAGQQWRWAEVSFHQSDSPNLYSSRVEGRG